MSHPSFHPIFHPSFFVSLKWFLGDFLADASGVQKTVRNGFVNEAAWSLSSARGHLFRPPQAGACPCARIRRALYLAY
jgi:hypothetical protein